MSADHTVGTSQTFARRMVFVVSSYGVIAGLLTLIGWFADVPVLTDWVRSGIAMFANTAIASVCAGVALILAATPSRSAQRLSSGLAVLVLAIGGLTLFQHISGLNLGIDQLLVRPSWGIKAAVAPGRMGPPASTCFTLIGIALLLLRASSRLRRVAPVLGMLVSAITMLSLIGYFFGARPLFSLADWTGIAFQTASILFALGLALAASVPDREPAWTFSQNTAAGVLARRSLPVIIALSLVLGWLRVRAQNAGLVDTAMGTAMLVLSQIILFSLLLWWCVRAVANREHKHKLAEDSLRESEQRLSEQARLLDLSRDTILVRDAQDRITYWNKGAEECYGYTRAEAMGQTSHELLKTEFPEPLEEINNKLHRDNYWSGELIRTRKDGTKLTDISRWALDRDTQGRPASILETNNDITDRKLAEVERELLLDSEQELRASAEEANRLKDEFLAIMSHELRNPLNVILGYSELLVRSNEITQSAPLQRMAEAIKRNAMAQSKLIRDLLDLSRLRSGKLELNKEIVSLMMVVTNAIDTVRSDAASKGLTIEVSAADDAVFVEGDPLRLEQIVWNLLNNSVKFTPAGGKITVRLAKQDHHAELSVEDTGQGIEGSFLPHAFEMFRQSDSVTTRAQSGMGIGLAVVQQLVQLHGGEVSAHSEGAGKGSTFTIALRLKSESRAEVRPTQPVAATLSRMAILVVDDSQDTTEMLLQLLRFTGARVTAASSGEDALRLVARNKFDVVLSDISMPGMDGFELLGKLREVPACASVPILALTGFGRPDDVERARAAGFYSHITKPIEFDRLIEVLQTIPTNGGNGNNS